MTSQYQKISLTNPSTLYEQDFYLWLEISAKQLRELLETEKLASLQQVDWGNLIEELEALGIEQKHKVESYLRQLLIHLLLYRNWESEKSYCADGWEDKIDNFRFRLSQLTRFKTLYNYLLEIFTQTYLDAKKRAIQKTKLPAQTFPLECPFTVEQVLNSDYLPE